MIVTGFRLLFVKRSANSNKEQNEYSLIERTLTEKSRHSATKSRRLFLQPETEPRVGNKIEYVKFYGKITAHGAALIKRRLDKREQTMAPRFAPYRLKRKRQRKQTHAPTEN